MIAPTSRSVSLVLIPNLLPILLLGALSAQTQVTVEPSKDNTLYISTTGHLSNGRGSRCFVGTTAQSLSRGVRRAVMAFDVAAQIPPCSTITKVELSITAVRVASGSPRTVTLHPLLKDWGEAGSVSGRGQGVGGASQPGDATWMHTSFSTQFWSTPGGDFGASSGSVSVGGNGTYTFLSTAQMVADAQSWLDSPAGNFGWLLKTDENTTRTAKGLATREAGNATTRPRLVITYTPPQAKVTSTGTGCAGSGPSPLTLAASGNPTVPSPNFTLSLTGGPAGNALFGLGFGVIPGGLPIGGGCLLYVDPNPVLIVVPGVNRMLPTPIPNQPSFLGVELTWQGAMGDPVNNDLLTSNALTLKLGQ